MTTATEQTQQREIKPQDAGTARPRNVMAPRVDIYERDHTLVIEADMPGVDDKSVDVNLENDVLTIAGRTTATAPEGYEVLYQEWVPADYERTFTLYEDIDRDNVKATIKNGVLRVVLPKAKDKQPRKIAVAIG